MSQTDAAARLLEKELGVSFEKAELGGHPCLAAAIDDQYEMIDRIRPRAVESERAGSLLFVGLADGDRAHRLFLVPKVSSLDVIALLEVGTHNAEADAWKAVHETMRRIHEEAPFSVYFADAAGYKATFAEKPDKRAAKTFEKLILRIDPEAMDLSDEPVWKTIHDRGVIELWWD